MVTGGVAGAAYSALCMATGAGMLALAVAVLARAVTRRRRGQPW